MDEQRTTWREVWRVQVLPPRGDPAMGLAARLREQDGLLAAEAIELVQQHYPEPQWLDVSLCEVRPGEHVFVVVVGHIDFKPSTKDTLPAELIVATSFADVVASLRRLQPIA